MCAGTGCKCHLTTLTKGEKGDKGDQGDIGPTGTMPYTEYIAKATQTSTNAPSVQTQLNTLGETITWAYTGVGIYTGSVPNATFTADKTVITVDGIKGYYDTTNTATAIILNTYNTSAVAANDMLANAVINIKVQP